MIKLIIVLYAQFIEYNNPM